MKILKLIAVALILSASSITEAQVLEGGSGIFKKSKSGGKLSFKKRLYLMGSLGNDNLNAGISYRLRKNKRKKWHAFVGVRANFNTIQEVDQFETAPAEFRTGKTGYENGFLKADRNNIDTFKFNGTAMNSLNAYLHLSYTLIHFYYLNLMSLYQIILISFFLKE